MGKQSTKGDEVLKRMLKTPPKPKEKSEKKDKDKDTKKSLDISVPYVDGKPMKAGSSTTLSPCQTSHATPQPQ